MTEINIALKQIVASAGPVFGSFALGIIGISVVIVLFSACHSITKHAGLRNEALEVNACEESDCFSNYIGVAQVF